MRQFRRHFGECCSFGFMSEGDRWQTGLTDAQAVSLTLAGGGKSKRNAHAAAGRAERPAGPRRAACPSGPPLPCGWLGGCTHQRKALNSCSAFLFVYASVVAQSLRLQRSTLGLARQKGSIGPSNRLISGSGGNLKNLETGLLWVDFRAATFQPRTCCRN